VYATQPPEGWFPVALFAGQPKEDGSNAVAQGGQGSISNPADASGFGLSQVQPTAFVEHGPVWGSPATVIELELYLAPSSAYGRAQQLAGESSNKAAQKLLNRGLKDLSHRDFAGAATVLTQATSILGHGEDAAAAAWLASH
jgi:hypothetical protein